MSLTSQRPVWIGADPGGKKNFGLAFLYADGKSRTLCVSCAKEAAEKCDVRPLGVGIDAPMWWSSGNSGDRRADRWIRTKYKNASGSVQTPNSLRGAALVQGVLFADELRKKFGDIPITESHPKALLKALGITMEDFCRQYRLDYSGRSTHERDAIISAVAAREGFSGNWKNNLALDRLKDEQDTLTYWLAPMHYFWPE